MSCKKYLVFFTFLFCFGFSSVQADCNGSLTNNTGAAWTAPGDCTISDGLFSIWGDATIGTRTLSVATDAAVIMNLAVNKMTFTTGKMLFSGNALLYGISTDFNWYNPLTPTGTVVTGGSQTPCPGGTRAWNPITKNFITGGVTIRASRIGRTICKAFTPVGTDGVCGLNDGVRTNTAPTTNLCYAGTPSAVVSGGPSFTWTCAGVSGGVTPNCSAPRRFIVADKVRITMQVNDILSLAEVQIYPAGSVTNVALAGTAAETSNYAGTQPASRAIDNNTSGVWGASIASTNAGIGEYWEVQLTQGYQIYEVKIWNRTDAVPTRLAGAYMTLFNNGVQVWSGPALSSATTQSFFPY